MKHMNGRWSSTLNYKNSAGGVVEVPVCFLWRMLGKLGIKAGDRKRTAGRLGQAAEKASNWL